MRFECTIALCKQQKKAKRRKTQMFGEKRQQTDNSGVVVGDAANSAKSTVLKNHLFASLIQMLFFFVSIHSVICFCWCTIQNGGSHIVQ